MVWLGASCQLPSHPEPWPHSLPRGSSGRCSPTKAASEPAGAGGTGRREEKWLPQPLSLKAPSSTAKEFFPLRESPGMDPSGAQRAAGNLPPTHSQLLPSVPAPPCATAARGAVTALRPAWHSLGQEGG